MIADSSSCEFVGSCQGKRLTRLEGCQNLISGNSVSVKVRLCNSFVQNRAKGAAIDAMIKELVATVLLWVFFGYIISDNATKCLPKQFEARQKNFELISSRIHIFSATP